MQRVSDVHDALLAYRGAENGRPTACCVVCWSGNHRRLHICWGLLRVAVRGIQAGCCWDEFAAARNGRVGFAGVGTAVATYATQISMPTSVECDKDDYKQVANSPSTTGVWYFLHVCHIA